MIFLAIPTYGTVAQEVISTVINSTKQPMNFFTRPSSMLTDNFNELWCAFMNGDYEYFAMIHADITAENGWIDKLMYIMEEEKTDVLSVVMPIKDDTGDTSTAFMPDGGTKVTRLSLKEVQDLPETFNGKDVGKMHKESGTLLVNTGLWLMKKGEWCKKFTGFHCLSDIFLDDGKWRARRVSEDWLFSKEVNSLGVKVHATRAIQATHIGRQGWHNQIKDGDT